MKARNTATRVFQYGLVPVGPFPVEGIKELRKANNLWNKLVEIDRKHRSCYEKARANADDEYAAIKQSLDRLDVQIKNAFSEKRDARMKAGTRDANHPFVFAANQKIDKLKKEQRELWTKAKDARTRADKKINKKALNSAFNEAVKIAQRVDQTEGLNANTANQIADYFRTARDKAFKDRATLRFHPFDQSGFFYYRLRRRGMNVDGVSFSELFADNDRDGGNFVFISRDDRRKKTRLRLRAKVAGGAKIDSKVYANFDLVLHRPISENSQIQNAKILRRRIGDKFKYFVSFTVREAPRSSTICFKKAIGVDIGFRQFPSGQLRAAAIATSDPSDRVRFVDVPAALVERLGYIDEIKRDLDNSAEQFGKEVRPLLKAGAILPEDHRAYRLVKKVAVLPANVTLSFELAYKFCDFAVSSPQDLTEQIVKIAGDWRHKWGRKFQELHRLRRRALMDRKHHYQNLAFELVSQKRPIGVEAIDLNIFAEVKDVDNKLSNTARSNRFLVSPSEFIGAVKTRPKGKASRSSRFPRRTPPRPVRPAARSTRP